MDPFTIQIAGLAVTVQPLFASTAFYCRPYFTDSVPDIHVNVSPEDLVFEQKMAEIEAVEEGLKIRKFTDPFLERASIQRKVARELLDRQTILLHGSTVCVDGYAYLFTAPCGTGKSTHTRFWREVFNQRAVMVNDDKTFLQICDSGVTAFGSPWSGKHGLDNNISAPLKGICFLRRGSENRIKKASAEFWLDELLHQCFTPEDDSGKRKARELVKHLSEIVPLWEMECTKDPAAAFVSYSAMSD